MEVKNDFILGEQPIWAGVEECITQNINYIHNIINNPIESLIHRGFTIIKLNEDFTDCYSNFHNIWENWVHNPLDKKQPYAIQQFNKAKASPNQYHGYSVVGGLKEQYMIRAGGKNSSLIIPNDNFGKVSLQLYEYCDQLCRLYSKNVVNHLNLSQNRLIEILDPVIQVNSSIKYNENEKSVYSKYLPEEFISSSLMDNFHYFNKFNDNNNNNNNDNKQFINNHGSHTDSGFMTLVVCTDVPGLEVKDQKLKSWVNVEELLHEYAKKQDISHRRYATIFWGDSSAYLFPNKNDKIKVFPLLHRVGQCSGERYSVVFKQRTNVTTTPPRYQEDYRIATHRLTIIDKLNRKQRKEQYKNAVLLSILAGVVVSTYYSLVNTPN